jgi:hypothetical protein
MVVRLAGGKGGPATHARLVIPNLGDAAPGRGV